MDGNLGKLITEGVSGPVGRESASSMRPFTRLSSNGWPTDGEFWPGFRRLYRCRVCCWVCWSDFLRFLLLFVFWRRGSEYADVPREDEGPETTGRGTDGGGSSPDILAWANRSSTWLWALPVPVNA